MPLFQLEDGTTQDVHESQIEDFLKVKYNGLPFRRQSELTLDEMWVALTGKDFAANNA